MIKAFAGPVLKTTYALALTIDPKARVSPGRFRYQLLYLADARICRSGREIMTKSFDGGGVPLGKGFDAPVLQVLNVSANLMPSRRALGKISVPDSLNLAADQEFPSDDHPSASRHSIKLRWRQV
jgi:hypothetical protein